MSQKALTQLVIQNAPPLVTALNQSETLKDKMEACAQQLSVVNATLKEELVEYFPLPEVHDAIAQNEDIEDKVLECADDLQLINTALGEEVAERRKLEQKLSESARQEERSRYLAFHDLITGLPNRALFNDRLEHTLAQAQRHAWSLAVLFIDLDKFKGINDTYGHAAGDQVLQTVGKRLQACVRAEDTVSRIGGDEFLCLLMEVNEEADVANIAGSMIRKISEQLFINDTKILIKPSIGIAIYPRDGTSAEALLENADAAMYKAKRDQHGYFFFNQLAA